MTEKGQLVDGARGQERAQREMQKAEERKLKEAPEEQIKRSQDGEIKEPLTKEQGSEAVIPRERKTD